MSSNTTIVTRGGGGDRSSLSGWDAWSALPASETPGGDVVFRNLTVTNTLDVFLPANLRSTHVTGNADCGVFQPATLAPSGTLTVAGATTLLGAASLAGDLNVSGAGNFAGAVSVTQWLHAPGSSSHIGGNLTLNSTHDTNSGSTSVTGPDTTTVAGDCTVNGGTFNIPGDLTTGNLSLSGLTVQGSGTLGSSLSVGSDLQSKGLAITPPATLAAQSTFSIFSWPTPLTVHNGAVNVGGAVTYTTSQPWTIGGTLSVATTSTLSGAVSLSPNRSLTVVGALSLVSPYSWVLGSGSLSTNGLLACASTLAASSSVVSDVDMTYATGTANTLSVVGGSLDIDCAATGANSALIGPAPTTTLAAPNATLAAPTTLAVAGASTLTGNTTATSVAVSNDLLIGVSTLNVLNTSNASTALTVSNAAQGLPATLRTAVSTATNVDSVLRINQTANYWPNPDLNQHTGPLIEWVRHTPQLGANSWLHWGPVSVRPNGWGESSSVLWLGRSTISSSADWFAQASLNGETGSDPVEIYGAGGATRYPFNTGLDVRQSLAVTNSLLAPASVINNAQTFVDDLYNTAIINGASGLLINDESNPPIYFPGFAGQLTWSVNQANGKQDKLQIALPNTHPFDVLTGSPIGVISLLALTVHQTTTGTLHVLVRELSNNNAYVTYVIAQNDIDHADWPTLFINHYPAVRVP